LTHTFAAHSARQPAIWLSHKPPARSSPPRPPGSRRPAAMPGSRPGGCPARPASTTAATSGLPTSPAHPELRTTSSQRASLDRRTPPSARSGFPRPSPCRVGERRQQPHWPCPETNHLDTKVRPGNRADRAARPDPGATQEIRHLTVGPPLRPQRPGHALPERTHRLFLVPARPASLQPCTCHDPAYGRYLHPRGVTITGLDAPIDFHPQPAVFTVRLLPAPGPDLGAPAPVSPPEPSTSLAAAYRPAPQPEPVNSFRATPRARAAPSGWPPTDGCPLCPWQAVFTSRLAGPSLLVFSFAGSCLATRRLVGALTKIHGMFPLVGQSTPCRGPMFCGLDGGGDPACVFSSAETRRSPRPSGPRGSGQG